MPPNAGSKILRSILEVEKIALFYFKVGQMVRVAEFFFCFVNLTSKIIKFL